MVGGGTCEEEEHGEEHEGEVGAEHLPCGREWPYEGGDSEDEGDVGDVGTCDVSDGDAGGSSPGCLCGDEEFGHGCAESDDGDADDDGCETCALRDGDGAVDEVAASFDEEEEAEQDVEDVDEHDDCVSGCKVSVF